MAQFVLFTMRMTHWQRLLRLAAALLPTLGPPATAVADCEVPELELVWSYPANGDTNVPTNAWLWALSSNWSAPSVTLDGARLSVSDADSQGIPLGALAPQHDYVLLLDYREPWHRDAGSSSVFEIRFRTGDEPSTKLPGAPAAVVTYGDDITASPCPAVLNAQDCFDEGQETLLTFNVADPRAIAWQVDGEVWPARCGKPSLVIGDTGYRRCFDVSAIGSGGLPSEPTRHCLEAHPLDAGSTGARTVLEPATPDSASEGPATGVEPAPASSASDGACSVAPRGRSRWTLGWLLLGLGAVLLARRARTRGVRWRTARAHCARCGTSWRDQHR